MLRIKNLIALLLISSFGFSVIHAQTRRPSRYLIPDGYAGWVRIDFNVAGAPPLTIEDGHYLRKIPSSGFLETSSDIEAGAATDEYFFYSGDQRKKIERSGEDNSNEIWAGFQLYNSVMGNDGREVEVTSHYFFVGTLEEYRKYGYIVGNVRTMGIKGNKN